MLALFAFALIWLAVALGLATKSVETASNSPMILVLLVFLSSGFVRTQTMPDGLRQFAEYQPFSPVVDTVRDAHQRRRWRARHRRHCVERQYRPRGLPLGHPPLQPTPSSRTNVSGIIQHHG